MLLGFKEGITVGRSESVIDGDMNGGPLGAPDKAMLGFQEGITDG